MSIKTGPAVPRMTLAEKIGVWMLAGVLILSVLLATMIVLDRLCPVGTDRWQEIQACWFAIKWGTR